jgi:hypothetical protein
MNNKYPVTTIKNIWRALAPENGVEPWRAMVLFECISNVKPYDVIRYTTRPDYENDGEYCDEIVQFYINEVMLDITVVLPSESVKHL